MVAAKTMELLVDFVTGRVGLDDFRQRLSDRLFELRRDPEMSEEKAILSRIQLRLHEVDEGARDDLEVYIAVMGVLDTACPETVIDAKTDVDFRNLRSRYRAASMDKANATSYKASEQDRVPSMP